MSRVILAVLAIAIPASAQSPPLPTFEIASVRVVVPEGGAARPPGFALNPRRTEGRLTWTTELYDLVLYAYDLPRWQLVGLKPSRHFYAIAATMPSSTTPDDVRLMFRSLLRDRFHIKTREQFEERPGYRLVVGPGGTKLRAAIDGDPPPPMPDFLPDFPPAIAEGLVNSSLADVGVVGLMGRGVPISKLAKGLSDDLGTFVQDRTNLTGRYYFGFTYARLDIPDTDGRAPTIFQAVEEALGMRLERVRAQTTLTVIEHVDTIPTEN